MAHLVQRPTLDFSSGKDLRIVFAMIWIELEDIRLSKISQSEKDNYHMVSLVCRIEETKQRSIGEERGK